jgi:hypothetical protein
VRLLVSKSADEVAAVKRQIAEAVSIRLLAAFDVTKNDNCEAGPRRSSGGSGKVVGDWAMRTLTTTQFVRLEVSALKR